MVPMISAIILAAGCSKRLGKPKQLLSIGKATILEQTVDNIINSKVNEVIVVLGHRAEEMVSRIASMPITIAVNSAHHQGMSTSILAGLSLISDKAQGVMISLADQPLVDSQTIDCLVEAFGTHNKDIIVPVYQGRRGNPVIFGIRYKKELLGLKGDIGGREIIGQHSDDVLEIAVNCEGVVIDIDTVEDYKEIISSRNLT